MCLWMDSMHIMHVTGLQQCSRRKFLTLHMGHDRLRASHWFKQLRQKTCMHCSTTAFAVWSSMSVRPACMHACMTRNDLCTQISQSAICVHPQKWKIWQGPYMPRLTYGAGLQAFLPCQGRAWWRQRGSFTHGWTQAATRRLSCGHSSLRKGKTLSCESPIPGNFVFLHCFQAPCPNLAMRKPSVLRRHQVS